MAGYGMAGQASLPYPEHRSCVSLRGSDVRAGGAEHEGDLEDCMAETPGYKMRLEPADDYMHPLEDAEPSVPSAPAVGPGGSGLAVHAAWALVVVVVAAALWWLRPVPRTFDRARSESSGCSS